MVYYLINIWKTSRIPRVYRENTKVEGGNRQNRLYLESRTPSWAGLWALSSMPTVFGNNITTKGRAPALVPRLSIT